MGLLMRCFSCATLGALFALGVACSSVPDVTYVDDVPSDGGSEAGDGDGGADAKPTPLSCPDNPPAVGAGVCCGKRLCLRCTSADCSPCETAGCFGTEADVCCRKNPGQLLCLPATSCF